MTWQYQGLGLRALRHQSQQGNPFAMTELAARLLDQNPIEVEGSGEATRWLELAIHQGHAPAMVMRGVWYEHVHAYPGAVMCFMKAALAGDREGASLLGSRYLGGRGIEKNLSKAVFWLNRAVDQGEPHAMMTLAIHYQVGDELPCDHAKAISLYQRAGEAGLIDAWQMLAQLYGDQQSAVFDYAQSLLYLRKAIEAGDTSACFELGAALYLAPPALRDIDEALVAFEQAQALGEPDAQAMIIRLRTEQAAGVPSRLVKRI